MGEFNTEDIEKEGYNKNSKSSLDGTVSTHTFQQRSFNTHISGTVSTHTSQPQFQHTYFNHSFNTHIPVQFQHKIQSTQLKFEKFSTSTQVTTRKNKNKHNQATVSAATTKLSAASVPVPPT